MNRRGCLWGREHCYTRALDSCACCGSAKCVVRVQQSTRLSNGSWLPFPKFVQHFLQQILESLVRFARQLRRQPCGFCRVSGIFCRLTQLFRSNPQCLGSFARLLLQLSVAFVSESFPLLRGSNALTVQAPPFCLFALLLCLLPKFFTGHSQFFGNLPLFVVVAGGSWLALRFVLGTERKLRTLFVSHG